MNTTNSRKEALDRSSRAVILIRETLAMIAVLALSALIGGLAV